jgi:hypothetical protein
VKSVFPRRATAYGYLIADTGPRLNLAKAAVGKTPHQLDLVPEAAPIVRRAFAENMSKGSVSEARVEPNVPELRQRQLDRADHYRQRGGAGGDRRTGVVRAPACPGHAASGGEAGVCADPAVGRRDDRGLVDVAAAGLAAGPHGEATNSPPAPTSAVPTSGVSINRTQFDPPDIYMLTFTCICYDK